MVIEGPISWGEKEITTPRSKQFKMEGDTVSRIAILSKECFMIRDHYSEKTRRHARCIGEGCPACQIGSVPKERFAAKILVYDTDKNGNLEKPFGFKIKTWVFGSDKFVKLRSIREEWGDLTKYDLKLTCTDKQFQKMEITNTPKAIWRSNEKIKKLVLAALKEDKTNLESVLGAKLSATEMAKRLGIDYRPETFDESDLDQVDLGGDLDVDFDDTETETVSKGERKTTQKAAKKSTKKAELDVDESSEELEDSESGEIDFGDVDAALDGLL